MLPFFSFIGVNAVSRYGAPKAYYQEAEALGIDKHNAYLYATSCGTSLTTPVADIFDFQYSELGVSGENDYSGAGWFVPTNTGAAKAYFQEGRYGESHLFVYVNDGTLTIGARRAESATDDMFVADDWTLKYYGNSPSAFNLIATDLMETRPDVESTPAQATIVSAYQDALDAVNELDDESKMAETYTSLAAANDALTGSQIAYAIFQNKVKEVEATMAENPNLEGVGASLLRSYLTETEEPGTFENGTANYILKNGNLDAEALVAEMAQMDVMLENALRGGVAPGTDITALFRNMNFDEADFAGWTESHTGNGSCSGSHGLNTNLVAGWWNMDTAQLYQTGSDLPNGIYAITANAFYRPGTPTTCSTENEISAYMVVNVSALESKLDEIVRLVPEVLLETSFADTKLVGDLVKQRRRAIERGTMGISGRIYAARRAAASQSMRGMMEEQCAGIAHLRRVQEIDDSFGTKGAAFCQRLAGVSRRTFVRDALIACLSDNVATGWLEGLFAKFPASTVTRRPASRLEMLPARREGFRTAGRIGSAAKAAFPNAYTGPGRVAAKMLSLDYLWNEIRVLGGAYGGGFLLRPEGDARYLSWNDPNPARSLGVYDRSGEALRKAVKNEPSIDKYIISTVSDTEPYQTPSVETTRAAELVLSGRTPEDLQQLRREMLRTTKEDLVRFAGTLDSLTNSPAICVIGGAAQLEGCTNMLDSVESITR